MEAVWNVEEKWKITTENALVLFACIAFAVIVVCTAIIVQRKRNQKCSNWVKLSTTLRWSRSDHHNPFSFSPLWQRPILMGHKCQLPNFSGLILYDQAGILLSSSLHHHHHHHHQVYYLSPNFILTLVLFH
ncbi:uncharacterized protein [Euphorbia lathyris]|uniref:uncharacterized protein n=1 Tax=Euphorbia lathyris TaxID=212925 RepID=UPI003313BF2E